MKPLTRHGALLALLFSVPACRCGLLAPGLGSGVAGAPPAGARSEAEAMASLATVGAKLSVVRTLAPVVAVHDGKALVLLLDGVHPAALQQIEATFTTTSGQQLVASGPTLVAERHGDLRAALLSFEIGDLPLKPVSLAPAGGPVDRASMRVVTFRAKGPPLAREVTVEGVLDPGASVFRGRAPAHPEAVSGQAQVFDGRWQLVGVAMAFASNPDPVQGHGAAWLFGQFAGTPRRVSVEVTGVAEACRVEAHIELNDPAGTLREAALVLGEPGVAWAIPPLAQFRRTGRFDAGSTTVPVGKRLEYRRAVTPAGPTTLAADAKECNSPRFAQILLLGDGERWLSLPFRLPPLGGPAVLVTSGRSGWRLDGIPAAEPLVWKGTAVAAPPEAAAEGGCRPPLGPLDPDAVHVTGRRRVAERGCSDGLLVFPAGEEERARCAQPSTMLALAADGWPIRRDEVRDGDRDFPANAWRRVVPDRNVPIQDGSCRLATPGLNDDLLAADPCGVEQPEGVFYGPGGAMIFACPGGAYVQRDGARLDLHGGQLMRIGEGGRALVRLPWGGLGVLEPDGKGREVGGLPFGSRLDRPMPSAASRDGFLVAVETSTGGRPWADPELFHISPEGQATSRGRFGPLEKDGAFKRYLTEDGALLTLNEMVVGAESPIRRWLAGQGATLIYDPARVPYEYKLDDVRLLLGWRSAGPVVPGPWSQSPVSRLRPEDDALLTYRAADPDTLPCRNTLATFETERVYLRLEDRILDPEDQERTAWVPYNLAVRLSGDGHLVASSRIGDSYEVRPLQEAAAGLRPTHDGQRCVPFGNRGSDTVTVPGGSCGGPDFDAWYPVPGTGKVAAACRLANGTQGVGDRRLSAGRMLKHVGMGGRLLLLGSGAFGAPRTWSIIGTDGLEAPVPGLPENVRAIRAVKAGFLLVVDTIPQRQKNALELMLVVDGGRTRRLGGYRGLPEQAEILMVAIDGKQVLHAVMVERAGVSRTFLVKVPLQGQRATQAWTAAGYANRVALLTGP